MTPLVSSLLAIFAAPLLDRALRGRARASGFADGLVQVVVGGILLVHVLPFGLATAGWPALLALGAGAMVGVAAHRIPGGERSAGALAVLALLLHSGIDGAALAAPDDHEGHAGESLLAWAVVLHTVPVGLATWRITRSRAGPAAAFGLLVATAAATVAGWGAAEPLLHGTSPGALGLAQCAVAGALLHVLGHVGEGSPRGPAGWGALAGVGVVTLLVTTHPIPRTNPSELAAGAALLTLLLQSAPALLLGYLVAGTIHVLAPADLGRRLRPPGAATRGALIGLALPVTTCGALPAWRRLLGDGATPAAGFAFLVAGPTVAATTLLVSLPLLGLELTLVRMAAVVAAAVTTGVVAAWWGGRHGVAGQVYTRVEGAAERPGSGPGGATPNRGGASAGPPGEPVPAAGSGTAGRRVPAPAGLVHVPAGARIFTPAGARPRPGGAPSRHARAHVEGGPDAGPGGGVAGGPGGVGGGLAGRPGGVPDTRAAGCDGHDHRHAHDAPVGGSPLRRALRFGFVDTVDHTAPWVLVGIGIAALAEPLLTPDTLATLPAPVMVVLAALLGLPAYVCAAGATPLLAVLLHKGLSAGAAIAFLVTGPATNVVAYTALRRLQGGAAARAFLVVVAGIAVLLGLAVDALPVISTPDLHDTAAHGHGPAEWVAAAVLVVSFAAALVRNGAAGFLEPLLHPHAHDLPDGGDTHDHAKAGHHGHAHGHTHAHDGGDHGPR